jgi:hypothetical protein
VTLAGRRDLAVVPPRPIATRPQHPTPGPGGQPAPVGDEIPQTPEEALRILGMGVARDVSEAAIKKIVDGLRMSWHPDGATSSEDRTNRELRIKQINAAWDILNRQRCTGLFTQPEPCVDGSGLSRD